MQRIRRVEVLTADQQEILLPFLFVGEMLYSVCPMCVCVWWKVLKFYNPESW